MSTNDILCIILAAAGTLSILCITITGILALINVYKRK